MELRTIRQLPETAVAQGDDAIAIQAEGGPVQQIPLSRVIGRLGPVDLVVAEVADLGLDQDAGALAIVYADPDEAANGYYVKLGASGGGSWEHSLVFRGARGLSAYEVAVAGGFAGSEEDWLASLVGGGVGVNDAAFGLEWDADLASAPSRHAVYQEMQKRPALLGGNEFTGPQEIAGKLTIDQGNVVNSYALEILNIGAGEAGLNLARAGGQGQLSAFGNSGGGWWNTYSGNRTMRWEVANGAYDASPQAFLWVNSVGGARANTRLKQATAGDTGDFLVAENAAGVAVARIAIDGRVFVSDAAFGAGWSGDLSVPTKNAMWAEVTYLEGEIDDLRKKIPSGAATAGRTLTSADAGKRIPATGNMTIPANAADAIPVDTVIEVYNNTAGNITVGINTDTLRLAGTATTGARTVAQRGLISLRKIGATEWLAAGPGVS